MTLIVPTATIGFPGECRACPGITGPPSPATVGSTAWKGLNAGAKAMAASAIDLLTRPDVLQKAQEEFAAYSPRRTPTSPSCPPDAKPPLDMNKTLMEKYRPLLEKYYQADVQ